MHSVPELNGVVYNSRIHAIQKADKAKAQFISIPSPHFKLSKKTKQNKSAGTVTHKELHTGTAQFH